MRNVKMTFTIPEGLANRLREMVADGDRSAFVTEAVSQKLAEQTHKNLEQELIRAYKERYEEDKALNEEWEAVTLENWPDY